MPSFVIKSTGMYRYILIAALLMVHLIKFNLHAQTKPSIFFAFGGIGTQQDWLFPYDIEFSQDSNLIYIYSYYLDYNESFIEGITLIITDTNLTVRTIKRFPFGTEFNMGDLLVETNGSIYTSGVALSSSGAEDGFVAKIDTVGNVWFFKMLGSFKNPYEYITDFGIYSLHLIDAGSGMPRLLACGAISETTNGYDQLALVAELDKTTGSIKWFHISRPDPPIYTPPLSGRLVSCISIADVPALATTGIWGIEESTEGINLIYWTIVDTNGAPQTAPVRIVPDTPYVYRSVTNNSNRAGIPFEVHWINNLNRHMVIAQIIDSSQTSLPTDRLLIFSLDANFNNIFFSKAYQFFFDGSATPAEIVSLRSMPYKNNLYALVELYDNNLGTSGYFIAKVNMMDGRLIDIKGIFPVRNGSVYNLYYPAFNITNDKIILTFWGSSSQDEGLVIMKMDTSLKFENACNNGPFNILADTMDISLIFSNTFIATDTAMRAVSGVVSSSDTIISIDSVIQMDAPPIAQAALNQIYICFNSYLDIYDASLNSGSWHYSQYSCDPSQLTDSPLTIRPSGDFVRIYASPLPTQYCSPEDTLYMWLYAHDINYYGGPPPEWIGKTCVDSLLIKLPVIADTLKAGFIYQTRGDTIFFFDTTIGATQWLWDFGDGNSSTLQNPYHIYGSSGTYNVCLTVSNPCASSQTVCTSVIVNLSTSSVFNPINIDWSQIEKIEIISYDGKILKTYKNNIIPIELTGFNSSLFYIKVIYKTGKIKIFSDIVY